MNKSDRHDISGILLKVALNTIILTPNPMLVVLNLVTNPVISHEQERHREAFMTSAYGNLIIPDIVQNSTNDVLP
jgi:hypothetical protein